MEPRASIVDLMRETRTIVTNTWLDSRTVSEKIESLRSHTPPGIMQEIFVPSYQRIGFKSWNSGPRVAAPARWGEPVVQSYLKKFAELMDKPDHLLGMNGNPQVDPVYSRTTNLDIKKKIAGRQMTETEYNILNMRLDKHTPTVPIQPGSQALAPSNKGVGIHRESYINQLPAEMIAVETGASLTLVDKCLEKGYNGNQINDMAWVMKETHTTPGVVEKLAAAGVDDWVEFIEICRETGCGTESLLGLMKHLGTSNVDDIAGIVDECALSVDGYAHKRHIPKQKAWFRLFVIFKGGGALDIDRTLDIFEGRTEGFNELD